MNSNDALEMPSSGANRDRRPGFSQDQKEQSEEVVERKQSIQLEFVARKMSTQVEEVIPEVAVETPGIASAAATPRPDMPERSSFMNGSRPGKPALEPSTLGNPDKPVSAVEDKDAKLLPADPTSSTAVSDGAALNNNKSGFGEALNGNTDGKAKTAPAVKSTKVTNTTKPSPISTSKSSSTGKPVSKPAKSPLAASTTPKAAQPLKPTTSKVLVEPAKTSKPTKKPTRSSLSSVGPPPKKESPQSSKPRSPTRPVKLPPSLTAPTASYRQKTDSAAGSRQTLAPSNVKHAAANKAASKSPSRAVHSSAGTVKSDRPSLGRPSIGGSKAAPPKKEVKEADEWFLARMMRPTAASKSKAQEKAELASHTPPKRSVSEKKDRSVNGEGHAEGDTKSSGSPAPAKKATTAPKVDEVDPAPTEGLKVEKVLTLKEDASPGTPKKLDATSEGETKTSPPQAADEAEDTEEQLEDNALPVVTPEVKKEVEAEAAAQGESVTKIEEGKVLPNAVAPTEERKAEVEGSMMAVPAEEPKVVNERAQQAAKKEEEEREEHKQGQEKKAEDQSLFEKVTQAVTEEAASVVEKLGDLRVGDDVEAEDDDNLKVAAE